MKYFITLLLLFFSLNIYGIKLYDSENAVSSGIGGAYTAVVNNPEVLFFNPANFYSVAKNYINISYNKYLANLTSEEGIDSSSGYYAVNLASYNISYIFPAGEWGGAGIFYSTMDFNSFQKFSILGVGVSAAVNKYMNFNKDLSVGVIGKYIVNNYDTTLYNSAFFEANPNSVSGYALDVGAFIKISPALQFGASGQNIVASDLGSKYDDEISAVYRFGIMYSLFIHISGENRLNIMADFKFDNNDYNAYSGAEIFFKNLKVRMGLNFNYLAFGVGYSYNELVGGTYTVNYVFSDVSSFPLNHKISLFVKF